MFVESSSFALSAVAGDIATMAGMAALDVLVAATPLGWVLIVGGLAVAGAAAAGSVYANSWTENNAGSYYDRIMSWISRL